LWLRSAFLYSEAVALPVANPDPAAPCGKSPKRRFVLIVVLLLALIGAGITMLEGDSRIALLIGFAPLLLVGLVCLCDPCCKGRHHHD